MLSSCSGDSLPCLLEISSDNLVCIVIWDPLIQVAGLECFINLTQGIISSSRISEAVYLGPVPLDTVTKTVLPVPITHVILKSFIGKWK